MVLSGHILKRKHFLQPVTIAIGQSIMANPPSFSWYWLLAISTYKPNALMGNLQENFKRIIGASINKSFVVNLI